MKTRGIKYLGASFSQSLRATTNWRMNLATAGVIAWIFCFQASSLMAQTSAATLPDLKLSRGGYVRAIAEQDDGKILIGGGLLAVNGIPRTNIARINSNGSLDLTWNPATDGEAGPTGTSFHIEYATNLAPPIIWMPWTTRSVLTSPLIISNIYSSTNKARFYRAVWSP